MKRLNKTSKNCFYGCNQRVSKKSQHESGITKHKGVK
jgi:hypothetical protein